MAHPSAPIDQVLRGQHSLPFFGLSLLLPRTHLARVCMREEKHRLRAEAVVRRGSLSRSQLSLWNRLIQEKVLRFSPYLASRAVALYSATGNEVATEGIHDHAVKTGKKLFYPKLGTGKDLALIRVESQEELRAGHYGILEPTGERVMTEKDREGLVVFVPGLAFDLQGNRLGRGGGWYDRVLGLLGKGPKLVGLAYELQLIAELPAEQWDQKVHFIITEKRVIDCGNVLCRSGRGG